MKNSNDTSWHRTSDLPICSTAPSPQCHRGPQHFTVYSSISVVLSDFRQTATCIYWAVEAKGGQNRRFCNDGQHNTLLVSNRERDGVTDDRNWNAIVKGRKQLVCFANCVKLEDRVVRDLILCFCSSCLLCPSNLVTKSTAFPGHVDEFKPNDSLVFEKNIRHRQGGGNIKPRMDDT